MQIFQLRTNCGEFVRRVLFVSLGAVCVLICFSSQQGTSRAFAQVDGSRRVPTQFYYSAQLDLYDGDYVDALKDFQAESRGAIKTPQSSWIDSICYRAMIGECYYHMGNYPQALEQYNSALNLYLAFSDWMLHVKFPLAIQPDNSTIRKNIPWGRSQRRFQLGRIPDTMSIAQGRINNNNVVQRGGVVQKAVLFPVNVHEIVRCTALAMRRRMELMGPVCKLDPLSGQLVAKLSTRPTLPNHWSESWVDLLLGLAHASTGDMAQAQKHLMRSIVLGGRFDHPLTSVALLELGKIAKSAGDFNAAARSFEEASYSAFYFENAGALEEALRLGQNTHLMANRPGIYPPLVQASRWAKTKGIRHLQVWLAALIAENYAEGGSPQQAAAALGDARGLVGRRDLGAGVVGAKVNYLAALVHFQRNQPKPAQEALATALAFQHRGSKWLFQISLANNLYSRGTITPRVAVDLYKKLLRDPVAVDWRQDPFEAISVLAIPHYSAYEYWFDAAMKRKEIESAMEISDRARRHRFYSSLPLGGRLLTLREILESPANLLDRNAGLQRQDLLVRYPNFNQLSQQAKAIRETLASEPLVRNDEQSARKQAKSLEELAMISAAQEIILREIALRREPADFIFPPVRPTKDIIAALPKGQAILSFFATRGGMQAFLISNGRYGHWQVGSVGALNKAMVGFLRKVGNHDKNREIGLAEISNDDWQGASDDVFAQLMRDSKIDLTKGISELIIVPDGSLWYLPFEALQVGGSTLISRTRIRYAPTISLATPDARPRANSGDTAVMLGSLFPRDGEEIAQEAFTALRRSVPNAVALPSTLTVPTAVYGSLIDRLVVLDDIEVNPDAPYGFVPLALERGKEAGSLARWFSLPWGGPNEVVLPGFHTIAEDGLKKPGSGPPGHEIFLSVCGMMSTGTRTILLSRWRTGGQTSFDLVREFVQELPHTSASDAWQRSVDVVSEQPLNWVVEPRVKRFDEETVATASHPFFWAGYMLVDTGAVPMADKQPAKEEAPAAKKN